MTKTRDLADLGGGFIQAGTGAVQRTVESKLQDVVSVKDFGAVGDGAVDESAQVLLAKNATSSLSPLLIPATTSYSTDLTGTPRIVIDDTVPSERNFYGIFGTSPLTSLIVDFVGDSTTVGVTGNAFAIASEPAPAAFQRVAREVFGGTTVTAVNLGVSGKTTNDALNTTTGLSNGKTFQQHVSSTNANVIFINFGINDANLANMPPKTYRANLLKMVGICQKYGKLAVLETPYPVVKGNIASADSRYRIEQFAEVVRQVSRETGSRLVDKWLITNQGRSRSRPFVNNSTGIFYNSGDGVHPNAPTYVYVGAVYALEVFAPKRSTLSINGLLSASLGSIYTSTVPVVFPYPESDGGWIQTSPDSSFAFNTEEVGDLSVLFARNNDTATTVNVYVDGVLVAGPFNTNNGAYGGTTLFGDEEIAVIRQLPPGPHVVRITGTGGSGIGASVTGFRLRRPLITTPIKTFQASLLSEPPVQIQSATISDSGVPSGYRTAILTDLPTSRVVGTCNAEVTFTPSNTQPIGFGLFCVRDLVGATNYFGLWVVVDANTGHLMCSEIAQNVTTVSAVDYRGLSRTIRASVTGSTATLFVDGVNVGTYTMLSNFNGGYFGLSKNGTANTTYTNIRVWHS